MSTPRRLLLPVYALLLSLAALTAPAIATAAPAVDVRGSWHLKELGYDINFTTMDCGSGAYTGASAANGYTWDEAGTVDGVHLVGTAGPYKELPSYTAHWNLVFSDQDHATGTWTASNNGGGSPLTATRVSGPPASGRCPGITYTDGNNAGPGDPTPTPTTNPAADDARHPTAMQVMCTYVVATSQDTCTATVGDAAQYPTAPTGTVTFGATKGTLFGDQCTLTTSPSAPSTGSCSVQYQRPYGSTEFPQVSGVYGGDATHAASTGATTFLILGGPPSFTNTYPNQVQYEAEVDADGTRVDSCGTTASTGSAKAKASALPAAAFARLLRGARLQASTGDEEAVAKTTKTLEELAEQLQRMDDKQTQILQPALQKNLDQALEQLRKNQDTYKQKLAAGASKAETDKLLATSKELSSAIAQLSTSLQGQCKVIISNLKALPEAATAARATAKPKGKARTATVLGTFSVRSAKAGKLPITLKLKKSALRKVATKKKPATIYIRTITVVPSGLVKQGIPRLSIQAIKVTRDGKLVP